MGPEVLFALPPSQTISFGQFGLFSAGTLQVVAFGILRSFSAPGLDFGFFSYNIVDSTSANYQ